MAPLFASLCWIAFLFCFTGSVQGQGAEQEFAGSSAISATPPPTELTTGAWLEADGTTTLLEGTTTNPPQQVITLRAGVLHAPPFATIARSTDNETWEYGGFQVDLLRRLQLFAADDQVQLNLELQPAPPQYLDAFDLVANDCERTESFGVNSTTVSPIGCNSLDIVIANFYANAGRNQRALLSPAWQRSTISTIKYLYANMTQSINVTTMAQVAAKDNATVCLKDGTFYKDIFIEKFPEITFTLCFSQDACLEKLKAEDCVLYASDELQLRHRAANDLTLEVTPESFFTQYIVWAARDDFAHFRLMSKWMYDANTNGTMDELYFRYFAKELCPVGTAGESCELPCDPNFGQADASGKCTCKSRKWQGDDCSIEVLENKNYIPGGLKRVVQLLFGLNALTIAACLTWLYVKRETHQVRIAQPTFLCLVLLGCLISSTTLIFLAQEDQNVMVDEQTGKVSGNPRCMFIPWFYSVGFSITFGTLFAKIRRVYIIFRSAAQMQRQRVTVAETLAVTAAVLLIDIVVLAIWTAVDPLTYVRTIDDSDEWTGLPLTSDGSCTCDNWKVWTGLLASIHLFLLAIATYLCYVSRDIPTQLSEGKYVSIAMFSNLQIFVVGVPILVILGSEPEAGFFVRSIVVWMNDFVVVTCIFGNLVYHVHFGGATKPRQRGHSSADNHVFQNHNNNDADANNQHSNQQGQLNRTLNDAMRSYSSRVNKRTSLSQGWTSGSRLKVSSRFEYDHADDDAKNKNGAELNEEQQMEEMNMHDAMRLNHQLARHISEELTPNESDAESLPEARSKFFPTSPEPRRVSRSILETQHEIGSSHSGSSKSDDPTS